jgi:outer membrane receptor protein involved in Fe transport
VNWGAHIYPTETVDVSFDVKHVGDSYVDIGNTFLFDPYTIVDAAVSWGGGPARFTLSGTNLFNDEYYWGGSTGGDVADPGRPRQVLFTTSFSFR